MAQQNEPNHSFDPATVPVKRKRGRPRKENVPGTELGGRTQRRRHNQLPTVGQDLVGQPVSGILDGVFDAGFLITVRVCNNGPLLRGMVFDSRISVPISAANDVAPHIKMSKRDELPTPISAEPLRKKGPTVPSPIANKGVLNDGSRGFALRLKGSESVISGTNLTVSKVAAPVTVQVPDNQRQGLTGETKVDSTNKASQGNQAAGEPKVGSTNQTFPVSESAGELKLDCMSQKSPGNETAGELKLNSTSQKPLGNDTASELKLRSTGQTTPGNETAGQQLKLSSTGQKPLVNEIVGEPKLESTSQISPEPHGPSPVTESDCKKAEIPNDSDQVKSSAPDASSEVLQETKTNPVGNGSSQTPSSDAF